MAGKPAEDAPVDPRHALAQQYLKSATTDIAVKEREERRARANSPAAATPRERVRPFSLSIAPATFVHIVLAMVVFTFAALAVLWCLHLMLLNFVAGRVVALPTGVVVAAVLSYLSAIFLSVIESTSTGRTEVDALPGDWRDWFWTLPSTLGMLAIAAFVGWFLSLGLPINVWLLVAVCALVLYPILQLSSLETGSPLAPLSLPVLQSFAKHPLGWFIFYAVSFAVANVLWAIARLAWRDPPYATVLIVGPLVAVALVFYAWLLGQLAYLISSDKESS
jgi:hypothetical protein